MIGWGRHPTSLRMSHIWFTQWKDNKGENATPVTGLFYERFFDKFFPRELKEAKAYEFINLNQGSMLVQD